MLEDRADRLGAVIRNQSSDGCVGRWIALMSQRVEKAIVRPLPLGHGTSMSARL